MATYGRYDSVQDYIAEREAEAADALRQIVRGEGDDSYHVAIIGWCRDRIRTARPAVNQAHA